MLTQTLQALEHFDNSHDFERMAADILNALGYTQVEPMAPKGGPDGGRDIKFMDGETSGIAFVTLDQNIKAKFPDDLDKQKNGEGIIALFCNVDVKPKMKLQFGKDALAKGYLLHVFDLERLRSLLDTNLKEIRHQYLRIEDPARTALLVSERKIVCGMSQAGTAYDFRSLLSNDPKEVIFAVQNLRTMLSEPDFFQCVSQWLTRNKEKNPSVVFILTTPELLKDKAMEHLKDSVVKLMEFRKNEPMRDNITIRFDYNTRSLSSIVCDPKEKESALLVFNPKWAEDNEPGNRLYCVLDRQEHDHLFGRVYGAIPAMKNDGWNLEWACRELKIPWDDASGQA